MPATTTAKPVEGQTEESKAAIREFIENANELVGEALKKSGKVAPDLSSSLPIAERSEDERTAILEKVGRFLDTRIHGPMFIGEARGKLFVGEYPRRQELLDVQSIVGNKPDEELTVGQQNMNAIAEMRSSMKGWLPVKAPQAQLLRANIDRPDDWVRKGIILNDIDWLASRDPYIFEAEIGPLWLQYVQWKISVEPTRDEIDFYYNLMH